MVQRHARLKPPSSTRREKKNSDDKDKERQRRRRQYRECSDKHRRYTKKGMSGLQMAIVILAQRRDSKTSGNHSRRIKNLHEQVVQHALHLHKCDLLRARQNSPTTTRTVGEENKDHTYKLAT